MFPVYVCYDDGVTAAERKAINSCLNVMQPLFGCEIYCYGTEPWPYGRYRSANAIVKSTPKNVSGQLSVSVLLDKLEETSASWIELNAFVLYTSKDLYFQERNLSWCFGAARKNTRVSVQSVKRFRGLSESAAAFCIRRTLRHELGHIFRCAASNYRSNTVDLAGLHCTNRGCSMRQAGSLNDLLAMMADERDEACFCEQCMADLRRFKLHYEANEKGYLNKMKPDTRKMQRIPHSYALCDAKNL